MELTKKKRQEENTVFCRVFYSIVVFFFNEKQSVAIDQLDKLSGTGVHFSMQC